MRRVLNRFRKKPQPERDVRDLWRNLQITTTTANFVTSTNALRPLPESFHGGADWPEPPPLRNRVNEVCQVCLDFDPTVDPDRYDFENDISVKGLYGRHPRRVVQASISELEEAAGGGCKGCYLICSGINWARPSFFNTNGIVVISVRGGLPLRISLHDGPNNDTIDAEAEAVFQTALLTALMGRDDYRSVGPLVEELEFYYPYPDASTWALPAESAEHPNNKHFPWLGYACTRLMDNTSEEFWQGVHFMLRDYLGSDSESPIRLVEGKGRRDKYMALSYCWGSGQKFTTTTETLGARKAQIMWNSLPALLQDVIIVARKLLIKYVWIDALCIIQDSVSDWEVQCAKMGDVYANAYVTLAAASAESVNRHILGLRHAKWRGVTFNVPGVGPMSCRRPSLPSFALGDEVGPISKRAWTMQERLLSSRVLTYNEAALKLECLTSSSFECQMPIVEGMSQLGPPRGDHRRDWQTLVRWYSPRKLTKPTDRLPAISALARQIRTASGWTYAAGLFVETFPQGLCWTVQGANLANPQPTYVAPSWSWMSVDGPVNYVGQFNADFTDQIIRWEAQVMDIDATAQGKNDLGAVPLGSSLSLVGLVVPCTLTVPDMTTAKVGKCCHLCPVGKSDMSLKVAIQPDTPLYCMGITHMRDKKRPAAARNAPTPVVPYPELSTTPFTAGVYCLKLGTIMNRQDESHAKAVALVLGNSTFAQEDWERLGLVDDLPHGFFDGATRELMRIV